MRTIQAAIIAAAFAIGAALSGFTVHKVMGIEVERLKSSIIRANLDGQLALNKVNSATKRLEEDQHKQVTNIQQAHSEAIELNANLTHALNDARLRFNAANARRNAGVSQTRDSGISKDPAKTVGVSKGVDRGIEQTGAERINTIVDRNAPIADLNTRYAEQCYKFIQSIPEAMKK